MGKSEILSSMLPDSRLLEEIRIKSEKIKQRKRGSSKTETTWLEELEDKLKDK